MNDENLVTFQAVADALKAGIMGMRELSPECRERLAKRAEGIAAIEVERIRKMMVEEVKKQGRLLRQISISARLPWRTPVLVKEIRLARLGGNEARRMRLTRKYWARVIGAKKTPRKQMGHWQKNEWQPWGWCKFAWYWATVRNGYQGSRDDQYWRWDRLDYYVNYGNQTRVSSIEL